METALTLRLAQKENSLMYMGLVRYARVASGSRCLNNICATCAPLACFSPELENMVATLAPLVNSKLKAARSNAVSAHVTVATKEPRALINATAAQQESTPKRATPMIANFAERGDSTRKQVSIGALNVHRESSKILLDNPNASVAHLGRSVSIMVDLATQKRV